MFCAASNGAGESWTWTEITPEEAEAASTDAPVDGVKDERWLALKLLARQRNSGTRAGYRRDLNAYLSWWSRAGRERRPLQAHGSDLEDYASWLAGQELAPATQLRRLAVASALYELAVDEQLRDTTPLRGLRRPRAANEDARLGLDAHSAEQLLGCAQNWPDPHAGTLVVLLLLRGLRISEALSLRAGDITVREHSAELRVQRKGHRARQRLYTDDPWLIARLTELAHPSTPDTPVFTGLDRFAAARIIKTIGQSAGLPVPLHPHLLRHTFVSQLLAAGVPVRDVQHLAGHASLQTTQRYADALQHSQRHVSRILRRRFASATSTPPASTRV